MKISIVKKCINPSTPSYLSGQINRISKHTGILDDLYCTALMIELNYMKVCLLSYDLLQFDESLSKRIRNSVSDETGISTKYIFTLPSHTHAAPEILKDGLFGIKTESMITQGYLDFLVNSSIAAVNEADQKLFEVKVEYAEVEINGIYGNRNYKEKPSDKFIRFLIFKRLDKIVGIFLNLSCHPTILGTQNTFISADLFGVIRNGLEQRYHCPIFMSNGAEGDMSNRHYRQSSDQLELIRTGNGILNQIPEVLNSNSIQIDNLDIFTKKFRFNCFNDTDRIKEVIDQNSLKMKDNFDQDSLKLLNATNTVLNHRLSAQYKSELEIEYSMIHLGPIMLLAIPLELFSSLYLKLKEIINKPVMILGLTNTSHGYCVDEESFDKTYEGLTSLFVKGEGERFIDVLATEIRQLYHAEEI